MSDNPDQSRSIRDFLWEHETEKDMALYSAIGRVIVMWGQLEYHFGSAVTLLYASHGAAALQPTPPFNISEKLNSGNLASENSRIFQSIRTTQSGLRVT